jgi:quercetin dioxygenase-like cupin family protein
VADSNVKVLEQVYSTRNVRVSRMELAPGEEIPWHVHTQVRDTFYAVRGPVTIQTRQPERTTVIKAGETFQTGVGQPHRVANTAGWDVSLLLIQGVGEYDFRALSPPG